jgi:hypothetical protein
MKYLGDPVNGSRIRIRDLKFVEEKKTLKHLDGWQVGLCPNKLMRPPA